MILYGFKYKNEKELNLYLNSIKKVPKNKSGFFYKLKHKKSAKGEMIFEDEYHRKKYWHNFGTKVGIGLLVAFFAFIIDNSIELNEVKLGALWHAILTIGKYFPVLMIFKALGFSKEIVFTKNKVIDKKFDEIKIIVKNEITYLFFLQNEKIIKKGFALVADDKTMTKDLVDFAKGYSEKANKVLTIENNK